MSERTSTSSSTSTRASTQAHEHEHEHKHEQKTQAHDGTWAALVQDKGTRKTKAMRR